MRTYTHTCILHLFVRANINYFFAEKNILNFGGKKIVPVLDYVGEGSTREQKFVKIYRVLFLKLTTYGSNIITNPFKLYVYRIGS